MDATLRVGYYMFSPLIGGAETYFRDLLAAMAKQGAEVSLIRPPWKAFQDFATSTTDQSIKVAEVRPLEIAFVPGRAPSSSTGYGASPPVSRVRSLWRRVPYRRGLSAGLVELHRLLTWPINVRQMRSALSQLDIDVLHVVNGGYPGSPSALAAVAAAHQLGLPVVLTICSHPQPPRSLSLFERWVDRALRCATSVIVAGQRTRRTLVEERGVERERVVTIPWGVEAPQRNPEAGGHDPSNVRFGTLANIVPGKGHAALLEAAGDLRDSPHRWTLLIAGDGPERATLEATVKAKGLDDRVRFEGRIEDRFQFFASLDIFVLVSEHEGLPYVILEAMSQGLPVVATDVGDVPEAVVDGETGLIVQVGDHEALVRGLEFLIGDDQRRRSMGAASQHHYRRAFTLASMAEATESLYRRLIGR